MTDNYYYMWEFFTSITILILIAAYVINDQMKKRKDKAVDSPDNNTDNSTANTLNAPNDQQ
ncbi:MAG: hypothetical protein JRF40_04845 [Deltaproteobacteria bacterium]|nr:hypothetical protein [Deltaproteobacteria bacterium]MBW2218807.1 hypothetical protein [Deltaproteobacteria bacterium]